MIAEILETERLKGGHGKLKLEKSDIILLIKKVSNSFIKRSPGVSLNLLSKKNFINIDIERVRMVLKNILENSIKYSKQESSPVEIRLKKEIDVVCIEIKDSGQGISDEHLPYLFEPFYRVDKSRSKKSGGYGLGLSLCQKIMEAHDGEIKILNNKGAGITVKLIFKL